MKPADISKHVTRDTNNIFNHNYSRCQDFKT